MVWWPPFQSHMPKIGPFPSAQLPRSRVSGWRKARLRVWVRSSTPNVDLQATLTEVRPDGKETFVQNGWVRANERKLDPRKSTALEPVLGLRKSDVSPLPRHRFVQVTIPLYYEGHVYRAGSRIRILVTAPNGDQPVWSFGQTSPTGHATVAIAFSSET